MPQLILAFDVVNQSLVPFKGSSATLPPFRQGVYATRIYLVQPSPTFVPGSAAYQTYDASDFDGIRVGFWSASTGTLDDSDDYLLALTPHTDWTPGTDDDGDDYFDGDLNTFTAQMASHIGAAAYKAAYFAVNLVDGTTLRPVFDQKQGATNVIVNSATDDGSGTLPVDMTEAIPTTTLPWHVVDPGSGEIYALTRTSAGVLEWSWLNP